jgi:hypothetical protein
MDFFFVFYYSRLKTSHVTQSFELGNGILILTHLQRILNLVWLTNVKFILLFFLFISTEQITTPLTSFARWFSRSAKETLSLHKASSLRGTALFSFVWVSMKAFSNPSSLECFELCFRFPLYPLLVFWSPEMSKSSLIFSVRIYPKNMTKYMEYAANRKEEWCNVLVK